VTEWRGEVRVEKKGENLSLSLPFFFRSEKERERWKEIERKLRFIAPCAAVYTND
jgi:hypothetical protein